MLPLPLERGSANLGFFLIVAGISDEYTKVATAQLVCPFSDKDNVFSPHKSSAALFLYFEI